MTSQIDRSPAYDRHMTPPPGLAPRRAAALPDARRDLCGRGAVGHGGDGVPRGRGFPRRSRRRHLPARRREARQPRATGAAYVGGSSRAELPPPVRRRPGGRGVPWHSSQLTRASTPPLRRHPPALSSRTPRPPSPPRHAHHSGSAVAAQRERLLREAADEGLREATRHLDTVARAPQASWILPGVTLPVSPEEPEWREARVWLAMYEWLTEPKNGARCSPEPKSGVAPQPRTKNGVSRQPQCRRSAWRPCGM